MTISGTVYSLIKVYWDLWVVAGSMDASRESRPRAQSPNSRVRWIFVERISVLGFEHLSFWDSGFKALEARKYPEILNSRPVILNSHIKPRPRSNYETRNPWVSTFMLAVILGPQ